MSKYLINDDGWNNEHLDETGITDFLERCNAIKYELDNCRRGSYVIGGDEPEDLVRNLYDIREMLDDAIIQIEMNIEKDRNSSDYEPNSPGVL